MSFLSAHAAKPARQADRRMFLESRGLRESTATVVPALFLCVFLECVFDISVRLVALLCIAVLHGNAKILRSGGVVLYISTVSTVP